MQTEKLTFTLGGGAFGLEDEYMADIIVNGLAKGIIACQAASQPVAERLREWVLSRLTCTIVDQSERVAQLEEEAAALAAHAADLERENAELKARLHQMDARRDAAQGLARSLAEYGHDFSYPVERVGSMDAGCSTIGIDSEETSRD